MTPVEESEDMAEFVKPIYGKGEIDRAGKLLVEWYDSPSEKSLLEEPYRTAYDVAENWRASHSFPLLVFQRILRTRAKQIDPNVIIAKRLKRFLSMTYKLSRESQMKLSQMQDLGGCRAILADVPIVYKLYETYRTIDTPPPPWTIKCKDYIAEPKPDGYRGIHIVGRYVARHQQHEPWNGHRIEIQLRSKLQHAFATAVETVTTFTRTALKFGGGPVEWRRFFSLMGSVLAFREATALVEATPSGESELIAELRERAKGLKVTRKLRGWTRALRQLRSRNVTGYKWLLIILNLRDTTVKVTGFQDAKEASSILAELEKIQSRDVDAVLVWVHDIAELKEAYPNYYADTREFLNAMNIAIRSQGIRPEEVTSS